MLIAFDSDVSIVNVNKDDRCRYYVFEPIFVQSSYSKPLRIFQTLSPFTLNDLTIWQLNHFNKNKIAKKNLIKFEISDHISCNIHHVCKLKSSDEIDRIEPIPYYYLTEISWVNRGLLGPIVYLSLTNSPQQSVIICM